MDLFTYGTLMAVDIMTIVAGSSFDSVVALLPDYRRYRIQHETYPGIIEEKGAAVEGVLYRGVSPEALARLDVFEGEIYTRKVVMVMCRAVGHPMEVMAYVVKPEYSGHLSEEPWNYAHFLLSEKQLFKEKYIGFDELKNS